MLQMSSAKPCPKRGFQWLVIDVSSVAKLCCKSRINPPGFIVGDLDFESVPVRWDVAGTLLVLVDRSRRHREPLTHLCAWNNASPLCDDDSPPQKHKIRNRLNPKLSGERRALLRVDLED
jgi:hypothetical protein